MDGKDTVKEFFNKIYNRQEASFYCLPVFLFAFYRVLLMHIKTDTKSNHTY